MKNQIDRARRRGAAMVEAVVVLPVFIVLFAGIFFLRDVLTATQETEGLARTCAWLYSRNACRDVPAGCEGIVHEGPYRGQVDTNIWARVEDLEGQARSSQDAEDFVSGVVGEMLGPFLQKAFQKTAQAETETAVERPALFGGGTTVVLGHYQIACNLKETTALSIAKDAWAMTK